MTEIENIQRNVDEFTWLQEYMQLADKNSEIYRLMKVRYTALKAILQTSGVNLDELDHIKE